MAASLSQAVESGPAQAQPLPDLTEVSKVSSASESDATAAHNATSQDLDLEHHQKEGVDRADDVEKQQSNTPAAPVSGPPPGDGILTGLPLYLAFTGMMVSRCMRARLSKEARAHMTSRCRLRMCTLGRNSTLKMSTLNA